MTNTEVAQRKRLRFLQRVVTEIREMCPPPFCLSVKLKSADYMTSGGLTQDEALEQVRWLASCGMVDFVEISGGNPGSHDVKVTQCVLLLLLSPPLGNAKTTLDDR